MSEISGWGGQGYEKDTEQKAHPTLGFCPEGIQNSSKKNQRAVKLGKKENTHTIILRNSCIAMRYSRRTLHKAETSNRKYESKQLTFGKAVSS